MTPLGGRAPNPLRELLYNRFLRESLSKLCVDPLSHSTPLRSPGADPNVGLRSTALVEVQIGINPVATNIAMFSGKKRLNTIGKSG